VHPLHVQGGVYRTWCITVTSEGILDAMDSVNVAGIGQSPRPRTIMAVSWRSGSCASTDRRYRKDKVEYIQTFSHSILPFGSPVLEE
jgi:hypothetical protein